MTSLGNIFDAVESRGERGPDLRWTVEVPRRKLGEPLTVEVPAQIEVDGAPVARALPPDGSPAGAPVPLMLPLEVPDGATLRLRGQGGVSSGGGSPGDLYLRIVLIGPARPAAEREAMKAAAAAAAASPAASSGEGSLLVRAAIFVAVALGALFIWMALIKGC